MLNNPWRDLPLVSDYVLPMDRECVARFNRKARPEHRLRLELLPEPFLGNPDAQLVLLNANPGFTGGEDQAVHARSEFARAARANLEHRHAHPFYLLDPTLESPGGAWWRKRLAPLQARVSHDISSRVFVAELHGYHSKRFKPVELPSQEYTLELVRRAMQRDAAIIVMRARRHWEAAVPELARYPRLHALNSVQNVTISERNCPSGFGEAVRAVS